MVKIYRSEFSERDYDVQNRLLQVYWNKESKFLDEEDFQEEIQALFTNLHTFNPNFLLFDLREFHYMIPSDIIRKADKLAKQGDQQAGTKKIAWVCREDAPSRVPMEAILSKNHHASIASRNFRHPESAIKWLLR